MSPLPVSPDQVDAWLELRKFAPGAAALVFGTLWLWCMLRIIRDHCDWIHRGRREAYLAGRKSMRRGDPGDE
jgi:hypothetical protein